MTDIQFSVVKRERRLVAPRTGTSKYKAIWDALLAGETLELKVSPAQASSIRSAWKAKKTGRDLHVIADGKSYIAWLEDERT